MSKIPGHARVYTKKQSSLLYNIISHDIIKLYVVDLNHTFVSHRKPLNHSTVKYRHA